MRNFVWLIFLRNQTASFSGLLIPYDCEFIAIQAINKTAYKITEIYTIKNESLVVNFGTWDKDLGLKASNTSFYRRRLNFQNAKLNLISQNYEVHYYISYNSLNQVPKRVHSQRRVRNGSFP